MNLSGFHKMTDMKKKSRSLDELININRFQYAKKDDLSIVDSRNLRKIRPSRQSYTNDNVVEFVFSTGTAWVSGPTSYLSFDIEAKDGTAPVALPSAMNLFDSVVLLNGEEIDRLDHLNLKDHIYESYTKDSNYLSTIGSVSSVADIKTKTRVCIPLSRLSGYFANREQLIPSFALAGMTLSLRLAPVNRALVVAADDCTGYTISNANITCDCFNLIDSARLFLTKKASTGQGLLYTFQTWSHAAMNINGVSQATESVGKPVAQALYCFAAIRGQAQDNDQTAHSFVSIAQNSTTRWRYRMGTNSMPDELVESEADSYMLAQTTFDKLRDTYEANSVNYADFKASKGILAANFERSHIAKLSGLPLNSGGRTLQLQWQDSANTDNLVANVFMAYVSVLSCFADGHVSVSI